MPRFSWFLLLPLAGCQLVLGFEDHEPFPTGGGGAGAGASTTTGTTTTMVTGSTGSQMTGGGGQAQVVTFGDAEEIGDAMGALTDLAVDGTEIYALQPGDDRIVAFTEGNATAMTVLDPLAELRGLWFDGGQLYTTATDGLECKVLAVSPSGNDTTVISEGGATNCYVAVGAEGTRVVASKGFEVRSEAGGGLGRLIGKAYSGSNVPAVAVAGGQYFWVDSISGELLRSAGDTVQPQHMPPGNQVDTLASMAAPVDLAIRAGQVYVVGQGGVGKVAANANASTFTILATLTENPKGISVDGSHVYWADGSSVRAVSTLAEGAQPTILYQGSETPNDTFSIDSKIFFTTQSGKVFRIVKTIE